jgi:hypothetical protein
MRDLIERRRRQAELFPSGKTLPDICLTVRGTINGSVDGMDDLRLGEAVELLRLTVATWQPSLPHCREIDHAVLALVRATIRYAEANGLTTAAMRREGRP